MLCDDMMSPAAGSEEADTPHQSAPAVEVAKGPGDQVSSFSFFLAVANSNYKCSNFDNREFGIALARKLGLPVKILEHYGGTRVRSNGNSHVTLVDPYGNGVASAPGVSAITPGDYMANL